MMIRMEGIVRRCLKVTNLFMGIVGIAMIMYGLWMVRVCVRETGASSFHDFNSTSPWFIYAFIGIGTTLCVLTCFGHLAAHYAHPFCLSSYMMIILFLILLETVVVADIILNSHWEKDLPKDQTGRFHDFKDFVENNLDTCQWIGLLIFLAQGFSVLLAMALRSVVGKKQPLYNYDSDDEYAQARVPLVQPNPYVVIDSEAPKNEAWKKVTKIIN